MANDFEAKIIRDFVQDIARKLGEASMLARAADLGKQGLIERAFRSMLDIEPLIHEASIILLNASSVVRRRERARKGEID